MNSAAQEIAIRRFFVVTGGPGSGKTTLIDALAATGLARTTEAGRAIIQEQVARGGSALPWADQGAFAQAMLAFELRSYERARGDAGPVIFDRGVPDVAGYRRLAGLPAAREVDEAIERFRYNPSVFIAPPWREIFAQDAERKQTFAEATQTFTIMRETYAACGYDLAELPCTDVATRVAFVRKRIATVLRRRERPKPRSSDAASAPAAEPLDGNGGPKNRADRV